MIFFILLYRWLFFSIVCMFHDVFNSPLLIGIWVVANLLLLQAKNYKHEIVSTACWNGTDSELETKLCLSLSFLVSLFILTVFH